jgi:hypothetical protein
MEYANFKIPVRTADGEDLGTMAQVDGPFMKVSRGWFHRDYWIPTEYIAAANAREVVLSFTAEDLPRYTGVQRLPAPEPVEAPQMAREAA